MDKTPKWLPFALIATISVALLLFGRQYVPAESATVADISYSEFISLINRGEVAEIVLQGDILDGSLKRTLPVGANGFATTSFTVRLPSSGVPDVLIRLEANNVHIRVADGDALDGWSTAMLAMLPWILFLGVYLWLWRGMARNAGGGLGGGGMGRGSEIKKFLEGSVTRETKGRPKITFDDVAGQENAKRDVAEIVDFLRNPEIYTRLGADTPHGILMVGPPGTGKTLLARALAGEAGVPFFSISGSEFIEVFVGVGASRVRRMFAEAKKRAPSIIFIDELDSIGRARGTGLGGGNDEREQTLNQILAELDGFSGHEAVIVLAATNRPDVLDPALLRPGRFDRQLTLDLPDKKAREDILRVHTRKVPLDGGVELAKVAASTPGFSGADLKNLVNEAAMAAARANKDSVSMSDFEEMRDKVIMGPVRTLAIQPEEHHRLAVHEAGHTLAAHFLPHADPLHKVTIIPRGQSLGATQLMPEEDRQTLPEDYLRDRIAMLLGGRTAEKELLGTLSSGADDDIRQATALARAMVSRWGMSEDIGPVDFRQSEEHPFLGREIALPRHFSEATAHEIDEAVVKVLREAEARDTEIVRANTDALNKLIAALEEHESLDAAQISECLGPARHRKIPPHSGGGLGSLEGNG